MAIHPKYPGLSVEILVNNEPLKEYDADDEHEPLTAIRYVEACSNSNFTIGYKLQAPRPLPCGVMLAIHVDGQFVQGYVVEKEPLKEDGYFFEQESLKEYYQGAIKWAHSYADGLHFVQKLRFSQLNLDDTDQLPDENLRNKLASIGKIVVSLFRITNIRPVKVPNYRKSLPGVSTLPEKALKGRSISHHVMLDGPQLGPVVPNLACDYVDRKKSPFATCEFKYGSLPALKTLQVVPRSPSPPPPPSPVERPLENLNRDELLQWIRSHQQDLKPWQMKAVDQPTIKQEQQGSHEATDGNEIAFLEERPSKRQRLSTEQDEVIVLD